MNFAWAAVTHEGLVRDHNEDALFPTPAEPGRVTEGEAASLIAVVADGMGGHAGGEVASRLAVEAALATDADVEARLQAANARVFGEAHRDPRLGGMGTTMTLAVFSGENVEIGHIGDSRAYLLRAGALRQLTQDHSLVAEMVEAGELTAEEALVHPYRNVITRALGMEREPDSDRVHCEARPGDRFLLCSDGLTSMLRDEAIAALLAQPGRAAAALALVEAANEAGGYDNISIVVVDVRS